LEITQMSDIGSIYNPAMPDDELPLASVYVEGVPTELYKVGQHYRDLSWTMPEGRDWHDALSKHYWARCIHMLNAGDTIRVHSSDHQIQFDVLILHCNPAAIPPTLILGYRAFFPPGLELPAASSIRRHRVGFLAGPNTWCVYDPAGAIVAPELADREAALRVAGALDQVASDAGETEKALAAAGVAPPKAA
jgi:hypothetical protein